MGWQIVCRLLDYGIISQENKENWLLFCTRSTNAAEDSLIPLTNIQLPRRRYLKRELIDHNQTGLLKLYVLIFYHYFSTQTIIFRNKLGVKKIKARLTLITGQCKDHEFSTKIYFYRVEKICQLHQLAKLFVTVLNLYCCTIIGWGYKWVISWTHFFWPRWVSSGHT